VCCEFWHLPWFALADISRVLHVCVLCPHFWCKNCSPSHIGRKSYRIICSCDTWSHFITSNNGKLIWHFRKSSGSLHFLALLPGLAVNCWASDCLSVPCFNANWCRERAVNFAIPNSASKVKSSAKSRSVRWVWFVKGNVKAAWNRTLVNRVW